MKTEVAVKHRQQLAGGDCCGVLPLQLLQPLDIRGRDGKRDDADRHHFQFLADLVDLPYLQRREPAYHGAAIGDAFHQAFLFQFEQRQPDIAAMGFEQVAKILLDETLTRLTPAQDDVLLDALGDGHGRRFALKRHRRRAGFDRSCDRAFAWFSGHDVPDFDAAPARRRRQKSNVPTFSILIIIS